ncbi:dihydrofolate reductase family protein [Pararhizobium sp.]|uniref:dihydrofolate reductase family protein n=1 Tax=Pararhizobium sp. TaxID=1977563 RepID=UPI00271D0A7E|nr:dihydrofolate reductase family protein [Pararhizobium sp.]MDO9416300.1 dihydrofolate reductase family protein [Pararhizobium sp.]
MAKVIVWNLVTLDGYFEGREKWDLSFHGAAWGPDLEKLSESFGELASLLVFGRVTYEGMKAYWTTVEDEENVKQFMNAKPKLVASRTLTGSDWNNTSITADIAGEISRLRKEPGGNIYIFGSAELVDSLLKQDLVDEIMLCIVPVRLGGGTPFFKEADSTRKLSLIDVRQIDSGGVILRYDTGAAAV